jgi:hypothetical protein
MAAFQKGALQYYQTKYVSVRPTRFLHYNNNNNNNNNGNNNVLVNVVNE